MALAAPNAQTLEIDNQIQKLEAETGTKTAAEQDEDLLNDLLGGGSTLSARRTNAEISRDEQLNEVGKKYGLTRNKGEGQQSFGARLRNASLRLWNTSEEINITHSDSPLSTRKLGRPDSL